MAKRASKPTAPVAAEESGNLSASVDQLIGEVRLLRQVLDEVREDLSWVTRNGLPVQPAEHVHVKSMARDVTAADWNDRLVIERTMLHPPERLGGLGSLELDRLIAELRSTVDTLAQGQIEPVLNALEEVRKALLEAMSPQDGSRQHKEPQQSPELPSSKTSPDKQRSSGTRSDRLF
ncbi:MAG TPA: hypothetical protein PLY87_10705 [Planctomycetaceae bacterium]|nr:hypothetical protein [Planctomycetaceae bacterium]HQZ65538.1 hypothetical protein [Planctomycetaceae bacterium]HRA87940.1 hypothetical protein [Planctomycetaceae bacterium]